jgi:IS30 family transposase
MINYIKESGTAVKSITFDNGSEFAEHSKLNKRNIKTYFCDPGKPYQKGSVENLNGVIRRYLPFEFHANQITTELVHETMIKVNKLPREILGWESASEYAKNIRQGNLPPKERRMKSPGRRQRLSYSSSFRQEIFRCRT